MMPQQGMGLWGWRDHNSPGTATGSRGKDRERDGGGFVAEMGFGVLKVLHGTVGKLFYWRQLLKTQGLGRSIPKPRNLAAPTPPACLGTTSHHHPIRRKIRVIWGRDDPTKPESTSRGQAGVVQYEGQKQHRRSQLQAGGVHGAGDI